MIKFDTTAAITLANGIEANIKDGDHARITAYGLAGVETIDVYQPARTSFVQSYEDGTAIQLTATNNSIHVTGPAKIAFVKGITASAVELRVSTYPGV